MVKATAWLTVQNPCIHQVGLISVPGKQPVQELNRVLDPKYIILQDPQDLQLPGLWDLGLTPIKPSSLAPYLVDYPIRNIAEEIFQGLTYGFMLNYKGPRIGICSDNLLSASQL